MDEIIFQLKCIREHLNFIKTECPSVAFDIGVLNTCISQLQKSDNDYINGATDIANKIKQWLVKSSNYWFSYTVNEEIDNILQDMMNK